MKISWARTIGFVCVLLVSAMVAIWWLSSRASSKWGAWLTAWTAEGARDAARSEIDGYLSSKLISTATMACGPQDWVVVLAGGACMSETVIHARSSKGGAEARLRPSKGAGYLWKGEFHRDIDMALSPQQSARFRELATRALALPDAYDAGLQSGFAACVDGDWRSAYGPPERFSEADRREPGDELWPEALAILQVETALDPEDYVICM